MLTVVPEPLFALDLIRNFGAGKNQPLTKFVSEKVIEPTDLAIIDASMLFLIQTLDERVRKFTNTPYLSESSWRSIISASNPTSSVPELNQEWLRADIEEFLTEVVSPMLGSGKFEPSLPSSTDERDTPDDEFLIHAFAVVGVGTGFIRGISSTIQNYGDVEAIIGRLDEYFTLTEKRGVEYDPFIWADGR